MVLGYVMLPGGKVMGDWAELHIAMCFPSQVSGGCEPSPGFQHTTCSPPFAIFLGDGEEVLPGTLSPGEAVLPGAEGSGGLARPPEGAGCPRVPVCHPHHGSAHIVLWSQGCLQLQSGEYGAALVLDWCLSMRTLQGTCCWGTGTVGSHCQAHFRGRQ